MTQDKMEVKKETPLRIPMNEALPFFLPALLAESKKQPNKPKPPKDKTIIVPKQETLALNVPEINDKMAKKQRRLIRNRVSAQLHRERKRQHVVKLESRIEELSTENKELAGKVALLTSEKQDMEAKLAEATAKIKELEDLLLLRARENTVRDLDLPDLDESFEMLNSPNSLDLDFTPSLEEDDTDQLYVGSDTTMNVSSSSDSEDSSNTSTEGEERRSKRRRRNLRIVPAMCLAAVVFTVSLFNDTSDMVQGNPGSIHHSTSPRSLLGIVSESVVPEGAGEEFRMLPNPNEQSNDTAVVRSDYVNHYQLSTQEAKEKSEQQAAIMQLALRQTVRLTERSGVRGNKTIDNAFKMAVYNELSTLVNSFDINLPKQNRPMEQKQHEKSSSRSLVVSGAQSHEKTNRNVNVTQLNAVRTALTAYLTHISESFDAADVLNSYVMCPSAYGILQDPSMDRNKALRQGQRRRQMRQNTTDGDLTIVMPSSSLYGSYPDGLVQLNCHVQSIKDIFR